MSTIAPVFYSQTLTRRLIRRVLRYAAAAMPRRLFDVAFSLAFSIYRAAIRLLYLRFLIPAALTGDRGRIQKILVIFKVMPHSLVGWRGLEATHDVVRAVLSRNVRGTLVECGVARGGCAALMGLLTEGAGDRPLWLFDSYQGLPEPTAADFLNGATGQHLRALPKGSCLGTYEAVQHLLRSRFRLSAHRIFMIKGWFQDSLPSHAAKISEIALLRIDADWYESVRCCLENLYAAVVPGGFVIIDDYGSCFGAQRAVDEFLADRNIRVSLVPDGRGGAHFQKPLLCADAHSSC